MNDSTKEPLRSLVLFQRDLRLNDQIALSKAISDSDQVLLCGIFDPKLHKLPIENQRIEKERFNLRMRLSAMNTLVQEGKKEGLEITPLLGDTVEVVLHLVKANAINRVYLNVVYEPNFLKTYQELETKLKALGVTLKGFKDHEAVAETLLKNKQGEPYKVFTPYYKVWQNGLSESHLSPWLVDLEKLKKIAIKLPLIEEDLDAPQDETLLIAQCKKAWDALDYTPIPISYEDLNDRFEVFLNQKVGRYQEDRDYPYLEATSSLSLALNNGLLSYRAVVLKTWKCEGAASFLRQLAWRHFYMLILYYFPSSEREAFIPAFRELPWEDSEAHIQAWKEGKTGIKIVDAAMRELNEDGKMHNRLRMIVASLLVKQLDVNWQIGEAYFYERLIDGDLALNNGGWQWCASTGTDAQPYFRIFNPLKQMETYDPSHLYIDKWLKGTQPYGGLEIDLKTSAERAKLKYKIAKKGVNDHERISY